MEISSVFWDSDGSHAIFLQALSLRHWRSACDTVGKAKAANLATFDGEGVVYQALGVG